MAMKSIDLFCSVVATCSRFTNAWPSSFRWSLVVSPFFPTSFETILIYLSLNIGMLIMRMYALYEQSRKVLALYIGVGVVIVIVGCVSLSLRENHTQSDMPLLMLWYMLVGSIKCKTSKQTNIRRLRSKFGSRRVSTLPRHRPQLHNTQIHRSFI